MLLVLAINIFMNAAPAPAIMRASAEATVPPGIPETDRFAHLVVQGDTHEEVFKMVYQECSHGVGAMKFEVTEAGEAEAREVFKQCMYDHGFNVVGAAKSE